MMTASYQQGKAEESQILLNKEEDKPFRFRNDKTLRTRSFQPQCKYSLEHLSETVNTTVPFTEYVGGERGRAGVKV